MKPAEFRPAEKYDTNPYYDTTEWPGYVEPTGTIEITENGEVDVAQYAKADVSVEAGGGGGTSTHAVYFLDEENSSFTDSLSVYEWEETAIVTKMIDLTIPGYGTIPTLGFDAQEGIVYSIRKASNPQISGVEIAVLDGYDGTIPYSLENGTLTITGLTSDIIVILAVS